MRGFIFELINKGGWFKNLLHGDALFLEVALANQNYFELNLGKINTEVLSQIIMPGNWKSKGVGLYIVPTSESSLLIQWVDDFFNSATEGIKERQIAGWIDGL